ncbi:MAG: hypothetical protein OXC62_05290 [Aestuariivita sp.]|nr:hypothetical protein [Aestuariivita sp.]
MDWVSLQLAATIVTPLVAVVGIFCGMMRSSLGLIKRDLVASLGKIESELASLKNNVHGLDVRLARLEERIPRQLQPWQSMPLSSGQKRLSDRLRTFYCILTLSFAA